MSRRILVMGGDGLLGHQLYRSLRTKHTLAATLHQPREAYSNALFEPHETYFDVAASDRSEIARVLDDFQPAWVLNAIGLVKRPQAADAVASLEANTVFPHLVAALCKECGIRLLHFSTDCVFSGKRGCYAESDFPDNPEWHGRCKTLGEPVGDHVLTLRTSFIGLELSCKRSLVEWFLAQRGVVRGYRRAIYSGLTTLEVARLADRLIQSERPLSGLWHVASEPISKYELLSSLSQRLERRDVEILPWDDFVCDRSLDGSAFRAVTGYVAPAWHDMLDELANQIRERG